MREKEELNMTGWATVILAAGSSGRMGTDKAFLSYDHNHTFIEKIIEEHILAGCQKIVIISNEINNNAILEIAKKINDVTIEIVINKHLDFERFYSIKLGIEANKMYGGCFIHNCDNPFPKAQMFNEMIYLLNDDNFVVPVYKSMGGHPILLGKRVMREIINENENNCNFKLFLRKFEFVNHETNDERILININTPEEYQKYFVNA